MVQVVFRRSDDRSFWKRHVVLKWFCFVLLASIVFIKKFAGQQDLQDYEYSLLRSSATFSLASNADNARAMQEWRETFRSSCQQVIVGAGGKFNKTALDKKEAIEKEAVSSLKQSSHIRGTAPPAGHNPYKYCKNTFIDLGTNIGDSIGHFVNNAIDVCTPMWLEANPKHKINPKFPHPWLDVTELKIHHKGQVNNPFCGLLQHHMSSLGENGNAVLPENTCVYGMEGNPEFTDRLQRLENYIMGMNPRPLQYLHIHTESVVTAVDGPTKLYLDKTSVEHNYWGSSLLSSHRDTQKTAALLNNGTVVSADVQGIALSTLVKNAMLPFKPEATDEEKRGGALIVKMDVEGGEYQVIKEVASSGVLCEYIKMGNKVVLIVEYHDLNVIMDPKERERENNGHLQAKKLLEECGVVFGDLQGNWY